MSTPHSLVWFRQDLRLGDNPALTHAAARGEVIPVYIYEDDGMGAASRWWLHHSLAALARDLAAHGVPLRLYRGDPAKLLPALLHETKSDAVFWNRCYEPVAIARDTAIKKQLQESGFHAESFNGALLFEPWEVANKQGGYFKVFTPFWNHCLQREKELPAPLPLPALRPSSLKRAEENLSDLRLLPTRPDWAGGLRETWQPGEASARARLAEFTTTQLPLYAKRRDFPAESVTSRLSPHLHFGEISPRQILTHVRLAETSGSANEAVTKFLSELGWREFSHHLLYHFPTLPDAPFRAEFSRFPWREDADALARWQRGQTGYPIVDAGMRELWHTGVMHNRVRMVTASFLTKHLLLPWQAGAAWFWDTLVDADLANNSASWQWVAGCGADAAPYFRIFNPVAQGEKFDPKGDYIRRWVPELATLSDKYIHTPWTAPAPPAAYPAPMVDHAAARTRALAAYKKIRQR